MSIQEEYARLETMVTDITLTPEQRQAASDALDKLDERSILENWAEIESNGHELNLLTQRLSNVITEISNNSNLSTSIDEISEILDEVIEVANIE